MDLSRRKPFKSGVCEIIHTDISVHCVAARSFHNSGIIDRYAPPIEN